MKAGDNMSNAEEIVIYSPMDGDVAELSTCPDQVFASGMLGKGVVIKPAKGEVAAPCDGVIESIFDTKHAIGMVGANEAEILIHVGLDTVNLNGEGFTVAAYCMVALLVISLLIGTIGAPETRGKSLEQITHERYGDDI